MRLNGFVLHGAASVAVLASGVGAAIAGNSGNGVTLAGPEVLRLIQNSPAALSTYPALGISMTMTVSGRGQHATLHEHGLISADGKNGTIAVDPIAGLGPLSFIAADDTMYVAASQQAVAMLGKHWVGMHMTPRSTNGSITAPSGSDALSFLRLMPGATGQVQVLGHSTISHVRTTHYRVTIDLLKAQQSMPPEIQHASAGQLEQLGLTTMPIDVWLDAQNAMRQMKFATDTEGIRVAMTLDISGSSTPVQVSAPPASDVYFVTTITELFRTALNR